MDISEKEIFDMFAEFAPTLDSLQRKADAFTEMHTDTVATQQRFWKKVGENLLALAQSMESCDQVCQLTLYFMRPN